jgi:hypothetical protein
MEASMQVRTRCGHAAAKATEVDASAGSPGDGTALKQI